ncbi:cytidine deaminase [Kineosporia sp. NBRC 101731]|uniref:cytidine deaminase n=1 Tax=Kineosporia sp. NBRC 101731 TaxID=3032199 RepID=UPI0024A1911F|nr:cytidine deaminase [Kineosporia sp. NBRC 101731]GLY29511.1 cytidine deaminase [Kineosporia sp. NBRC 101731]
MELIDLAADRLHPVQVDDRLSGSVAAAILTRQGDLFFGVCIDTRCSLGFCAEAAAVAAMITAGQSHIDQVVAVTRNEQGQLEVLPPCGRCREFLHQIDRRNLEAGVILDRETVRTLRDLLPEITGRPVGPAAR